MLQYDMSISNYIDITLDIKSISKFTIWHKRRNSRYKNVLKFLYQNMQQKPLKPSCIKIDIKIYGSLFAERTTALLFRLDQNDICCFEHTCYYVLHVLYISNLLLLLSFLDFTSIQNICSYFLKAYKINLLPFLVGYKRHAYYY